MRQAFFPTTHTNLFTQNGKTTALTQERKVAILNFETVSIFSVKPSYFNSKGGTAINSGKNIFCQE